MDYSVSYFTNMLQVDKALHYFGVGFFCFIWVFLFFFYLCCRHMHQDVILWYWGLTSNDYR